jgi:putative transposase
LKTKPTDGSTHWSIRSIAAEKAISKTSVHGSFKSVRELVRKIETFVSHYDTPSKPFAWTATADSILA